MVIVLIEAVPHTPDRPEYIETRENYVFNASDSRIDVHREPDTYREKDIDIWKSHAPEAYYGESDPHVGGLA